MPSDDTEEGIPGNVRKTLSRDLSRLPTERRAEIDRIAEARGRSPEWALAYAGPTATLEELDADLERMRNSWPPEVRALRDRGMTLPEAIRHLQAQGKLPSLDLICVYSAAHLEEIREGAVRRLAKRFPWKPHPMAKDLRNAIRQEAKASEIKESEVRRRLVMSSLPIAIAGRKPRNARDKGVPGIMDLTPGEVEEIEGRIWEGLNRLCKECLRNPNSERSSRDPNSERTSEKLEDCVGDLPEAHTALWRAEEDAKVLAMAREIGLSNRELQTLVYRDLGYSNAEIATLTERSESTIDEYVRRSRKKYEKSRSV